MNSYNIIAIMGKAGSGKDTLLKALLQELTFTNIARPIISCTTRPIREGEVDGVDYHYLTREQFTDQVLNGDMLEATVFNNWCYGTSLTNLSQNHLNIGVFNPEGVEILRDNKNINLFVIYIQADDKTRLLRQLNREGNPDCHEIVRRFGTDEEDFNDEVIDYIQPDLYVANGDGINIHNIAKQIAAAWESGQISLKN